MDDAQPPIEPGLEGWTQVGFHHFDAMVGPYYWRVDEARMRVGFRAQTRHLNGLGAVHGGCLMAFADTSLFLIGREALRGPAVTVTLGGEYLGPARAGDFIEATGEVTRAGGSLVFVRGMVTAHGRPTMSFSAVVKRLPGK